MNGARARDRVATLRFQMMAVLGDGHWHTTTDLALGRSWLTEAVYRLLPMLERQGLIEVVRGGPRVLVRIVYNPELYALVEVSDA